MKPTLQVSAFRRAPQPPALLSEETDLTELSKHVDFSRMPAWSVRLGVDKEWYKDKPIKAKRSDETDMNHLAILPYVDFFVTEKHLANMLSRSKASHHTSAEVFYSLDKWVFSTESNSS